MISVASWSLLVVWCKDVDRRDEGLEPCTLKGLWKMCRGIVLIEPWCRPVRNHLVSTTILSRQHRFVKLRAIHAYLCAHNGTGWGLLFNILRLYFVRGRLCRALGKPMSWPLRESTSVSYEHLEPSIHAAPCEQYPNICQENVSICETT